ncbi:MULTISPECIES: sodium:proton antiporter [Methanobacterium]|jgi:NhaP-type Na+/H+ or K+/H+ antiporter|uniref:Na+/H+ antiporter n=1 Tax=Methanobacterium formicicum TaxID=2162 RepID=A0A089ZB36_METFO|nr:MULTISPECIES: sodium:proton antiporter [Methanobacterium]AIS31247.1 transporter Na+/H+ antiporter family [Methanobacterium formicicum]KUK72048.1 MAG: Na+/H+ antiporter [Methanobacterium sp. 42_16]MBF4474413.1 sodium:proton antiporter [Methanobacterium formicicum]MDD4810476.1 sodium:proton antiporter [Methanobacterium formicicum]MDG3547903.1 sodium:proton antiporter [Methanobacterium formicicum]
MEFQSVAFSVAIIILLGLLASKLFNRIKLPGLLGMLILGIVIGPYGFNLIDKAIMAISGDLRAIALIIILLRAGFGIHMESLRKVGMSAVKMSFIPDVVEGLTITFVSHYLLGLPLIEAGMLGFIIAAVSPAVIVPQMLSFIKRRMGTGKGIPLIILTGASVDDVVSITIFSIFLGMYGGQQVNYLVTIFSIPLQFILGILLGLVIAVILIYLFKRFNIRNTEKTLIILASAIILKNLGDVLSTWVPIAALVGVMVIGFVILEKMPELGMQLSSKFDKIWIFAEILLFVLVGAQVNIYLAASFAVVGLTIIIIGLAARSAGVYLALAGSNLNLQEKIFCIIAYMPKATVQAAIGAIPLSMGVASGQEILAIAVIAILFTAPLGAMGVSWYGEKALKVDENAVSKEIMVK